MIIIIGLEAPLRKKVAVPCRVAAGHKLEHERHRGADLDRTTGQREETLLLAIVDGRRIARYARARTRLHRTKRHWADDGAAIGHEQAQARNIGPDCGAHCWLDHLGAAMGPILRAHDGSNLIKSS